MKRISLFLVVLVAASCSQRLSDPNEVPAGASLALTTTGADYEAWTASEAGLIKDPAGVSRATETNFQAMDSIGVYLYTGALGAGPYHSTNMRYYTKDGTPDGTTSPQWTASTAMGGPLVAGTAYSAVAYYPYKPSATNASAVAHSVAADQTPAYSAGSAKALELSDFLWAPPVAVANASTVPSVTLAFQHLMCKLAITLQVPSTIDGAAVTKLNSVAIKNLNTSCVVHLGTGAVSGLGAVKDIAPRVVSANVNPGTVAVYEAVVVPQTAASGAVLVEVKCQTASGEKTANYFPPAAGLVLGSGKKIALALTSAADIAFTSEVDLVTGQAYTDLPLKVKVASGVAWTLTAPTGSWITVASTSGGAYGTTATGVGTGADQTVYVKVTANTGAGATARQALLTLSGTIAGAARTVTYTAVQNYSKPVVGFPVTSVIMDGLSYQLPAVDGNSNWYIKSTNIPSGVRLSRRNVAWSALTAADTVDVFTQSTTGLKTGYMVSGNYFNSNGALYVVTDPDQSPIFDMTCNGVAVKMDARSLLVNGLHWARGNLVATGARGAASLGGCQIGTRNDGGLYFQFGSLIGWKGGNVTNPKNSGNGIGMPTDPHVTNNMYWDGQSVAWPGWTVVSYVWPNTMIGNPTAWPVGLTGNKWFFSLQTGGWDQEGKNIRDFAGFKEGTLAVDGVGDPCSYYLGTQWRTPLASEFEKLFEGVPATNSFPSLGWVLANMGINQKYVEKGAFRMVMPGWYNKDYGICELWSLQTSYTTSITGRVNTVAACNLSGYQNQVVPKLDEGRQKALPCRCVRN